MRLPAQHAAKAVRPGEDRDQASQADAYVGEDPEDGRLSPSGQRWVRLPDEGWRWRKWQRPMTRFRDRRDPRGNRAFQDREGTVAKRHKLSTQTHLALARDSVDPGLRPNGVGL